MLNKNRYLLATLLPDYLIKYITSDYTVSGYIHGENISAFVKIDSRNSHEQVPRD
jgi:hypothetical protein